MCLLDIVRYPFVHTYLCYIYTAVSCAQLIYVSCAYVLDKDTGSNLVHVISLVAFDLKASMYQMRVGLSKTESFDLGGLEVAPQNRLIQR